METKDHYFIGERIVKCFEEHMNIVQRKAFLAGCVEPDLNPFSFLKGSMQYQMLHGHNYENASGVIRKYMTQLNCKRKWSLYMYYKLGILLHYAADAFTFPHNEQFEGSLQEHMEYEHELHMTLIDSQEVDTMQVKTVGRHEMDSFYDFMRLHNRYLMGRSGMKDDIYYILRICQELSSKLVVVNAKQGVGVEATVVL